MYSSRFVVSPSTIIWCLLLPQVFGVCCYSFRNCWAFCFSLPWTRERIMAKNCNRTLRECCPEMNGQSHQNFIQICTATPIKFQPPGDQLVITNPVIRRTYHWKLLRFFFVSRFQIDGAQTARHPEKLELALNTEWKLHRWPNCPWWEQDPHSNLMLLSFFFTQTDQKILWDRKETSMHGTRTDPQHFNTFLRSGHSKRSTNMKDRYMPLISQMLTRNFTDWWPLHQFTVVQVDACGKSVEIRSKQPSGLHNSHHSWLDDTSNMCVQLKHSSSFFDTHNFYSSHTINFFFTHIFLFSQNFSARTFVFLHAQNFLFSCTMCFVFRTMCFVLPHTLFFSHTQCFVNFFFPHNFFFHTQLFFFTHIKHFFFTHTHFFLRHNWMTLWCMNAWTHHGRKLQIANVRCENVVPRWTVNRFDQNSNHLGSTRYKKLWETRRTYHWELLQTAMHPPPWNISQKDGHPKRSTTFFQFFYPMHHQCTTQVTLAPWTSTNILRPRLRITNVPRANISFKKTFVELQQSPHNIIHQPVHQSCNWSSSSWSEDFTVCFWIRSIISTGCRIFLKLGC